MRPLQTDFSIYNKLNLTTPPIGVKFLFFRPKGIEQPRNGQKPIILRNASGSPDNEETFLFQ